MPGTLDMGDASRTPPSGRLLPHHRWHDLAVDRTGHLDGCGLVGPVTDSLHQRMVKVPVVTTLAIDEPDPPVAAEATAPRRWPARRDGRANRRRS